MVFYKIKDGEKEPVRKDYNVKVRFKNFKLNTWKDLITLENITFMELDDILKTLWGFQWKSYVCFHNPRGRYMIMDGDFSNEIMMYEKYDSNFTLINDFFEKTKKITYWYDFTDDWKFDIEIKKKSIMIKNTLQSKGLKENIICLMTVEFPFNMMKF